MTDWTLDDVTARLRAGLARPLPGREAQLRMAPAHREGLVREADVTRSKEAAVLILLGNPPAPSILLTERRHDLLHHPGQISFPGGRREPEESLEQTALREAREEVGVLEDDVEILGALTPLYIPPSDYVVHPFVGVTRGTVDLSPADSEVSAVIYANVGVLGDRTNRCREYRDLRRGRVEVPYFAIAGHKVWGATAMMLAELIDVLES